MALRSGLAAQLGLAAETTFGTRVTPDHFYELVSESMKLNRTRVPAKGIRPSKLMNRSQRFRTTKVDVTGDFVVECQSCSYGLLFKHMLGSASAVADGAGWKRTYTMGDTYGLSLTAQVGKPSTDGTVNVHEYTGCKIVGWEFSTALDQVLSLKVTLDGQNESTNQTLATPSWPSATYNEVFYVDEVTLTIGGAAVKCNSMTLTGKNNVKIDRYFLGAQTKSEQLLDNLNDVTGSLKAEFVDETLYNLFVGDTTTKATAQLIVTATGQLNYDTGKPNKIIITLPAVRYDGDTPNVSGPGVIEQTIPFTVLDNDTDVPVTIEYDTSSATD